MCSVENWEKIRHPEARENTDAQGSLQFYLDIIYGTDLKQNLGSSGAAQLRVMLVLPPGKK